MRLNAVHKPREITRVACYPNARLLIPSHPIHIASSSAVIPGTPLENMPILTGAKGITRAMYKSMNLSRIRWRGEDRRQSPSSKDALCNRPSGGRARERERERETNFGFTKESNLVRCLSARRKQPQSYSSREKERRSEDRERNEKFRFPSFVIAKRPETWEEGEAREKERERELDDEL